MTLKSFITVLLGLVFQLAQVLPGGAIPSPVVAATAKACECCAGSHSCCCAKNELPAHKPLPQPLHGGGLHKGMAMKTAETRVSADVWQRADGLTGALAAPSSAAARVGFAGVSLAVAYCSFVI
ncbi:MAG: hypothetical protein WCJ66_00895 [Verrucomicrobiota bacterium]